MVKIPLTVKQINALLKWRDEHKELVRALVVPFPCCEIISENGVKIRVQHDGELQSVYSFLVSDTIKHKIKGRFSYLSMTGAVHHGAPQLSHDDTQTAITVWATVMAYIVNFEPEFVEKEKGETVNKEINLRNTSPHSHKRPHNSALYLNQIKHIAEGKNATQRKYTRAFLCVLCAGPLPAFEIRQNYICASV